MRLLQGPPLQPRLFDVSKRGGTSRGSGASRHMHAMPDPGAEPEVSPDAYGPVQMPHGESRVLRLPVNGPQLGALPGRYLHKNTEAGQTL